MIGKTTFMDRLAASIILGSFIFYGFILWFYVQNKLGESNYISQILTALIALDSLVLAYYFGSSKSSASKDATIKSMQENAANPNLVDTTIKADVVNTDNIDTVNTNTVNTN